MANGGGCSQLWQKTKTAFRSSCIVHSTLARAKVAYFLWPKTRHRPKGIPRTEDRGPTGGDGGGARSQEPVNIMDHVIVIRDYRPGDELQCKEILREGTMSTVNTAFFAGLTREITFQAMVVTSAVMFIFMGVPLSVCLGAIPVVIVVMYIIIYLGHTFKAHEMMQDISNIPRFYMSSDSTGFWVAEACEPMFMSQEPKHAKYLVMTEGEMQQQCIQFASHLRRKVVGTIAVTKSKNEENTAWLRRMSVHPLYQRKGVGSKLVDQVTKFAAGKGYSALELVTTECHNGARELYLNKGFELKQMYHRHVFGSLVSVLVYELSLSLKKRLPLNL